MNLLAVQPLVVVLEDELAVQRELRDVLREQRACLQAADDAGFEASLVRIGELLERAAVGRRRRRDVLRSLGYDEHVETPVDNLARRLPEGPRGRLATLRGDLVALAGEVRSMSQFNSGLVRRASVVNRELLRVLVGPSGDAGGALVDSRA